jgi:hypothetical protein
MYFRTLGIRQRWQTCLFQQMITFPGIRGRGISKKGLKRELFVDGLIDVFNVRKRPWITRRTMEGTKVFIVGIQP